MRSSQPTRPGSAGWWSFTNVIPAPLTPGGAPNGMFGISCPSLALCVAAGQNDQIIASTNAFSPEPSKLHPVGQKGRKRRPRVTITWHPPKRVEARKDGARVGFRFRTAVKSPRFKCKLNRRRFSGCRPPKRYRLRRGRYVFRVFAIAPTGFKGPPAAFHFRIGRLSESPPSGPAATGRPI